MKKRIIPKKNYIIMFVITILVVVLTLYLSAWYKTIKEYYENNSVLTGVVNEIDEMSMPSYLLDNPNIVIYLASSNDSSIKSFEKKMKKYIKDNDLKNEIIYFDTTGLENNQINNIFIGYASSTLKNLRNISVPNMLYFENGEIVDILYFKKKTIIKNDVISFLERNNVIIND